mgnify:FL=1|jgi:hypothetical protein|tara:strand:+ start:1123 stop:1488 length:366 start_codon:yes stop_codon:yes gene_type:complete
MTDKTIDFESQLEMASLLPDRHYIVLKPNGEDNFTMSAYDTTKVEEDDEFFGPAFIAQHGLIAILRDETDYVIEKGMEELAYQHIAESIEEFSDDDDTEVKKVAQRVKEGNVVKVDFGRKH